MKTQIVNLIFIVISLFLVGHFADAQNTVGELNAGGTDINTNPGGTVQEIKKTNSKVIGSRYLNEKWTKGSIELTGGNSLTNKLFRYDVENRIIEIFNSADDIKVINETFIKSVRVVSNRSIQDDLLLNGKQFYLNYIPLTGLVLSEQIEGKYNMITRFNVKKSEAQYIRTLDAGNEENIISIEKKYYLAKDKELTEIPNSKKKVMALFTIDVDPNKIKSFVNANDLNLKKYRDLVFLVNYINRQIE